MHSMSTKIKTDPAAPENPGVKFYLGLGIFIVSFFMLPTGLILKSYAPTHHWKLLIMTIFWLSAPLMKIFSIAIMGKSSYLYIQYRIRHFYHHVAKIHEVSQTRYNIGLVMFIVPFVPNYILAYAPHLFPNAYMIRSFIHFFFDVVFISSLFVLGGDFWDKLRALFSYTAKARFEEDEEHQ